MGLSICVDSRSYSKLDIEHRCTFAYVWLSHTHTGSYDCLILRLVVIWRTCDRSAMFATISRSGRILRSVFFAGGRSLYDWSYDWSRDQHRLEKIVRLVVAINHRSYDQSCPPTIDRTINSVGRRMESDLNPRNISTFNSVSEQPFGGTTGRKVARPVARLIVQPLTIWNSRFQFLNMTIDLVAIVLRLAHHSNMFGSQVGRNLVESPV